MRKKNGKLKNMDSLTYLKKVKILGIVGIIISVILFVYDISMYNGAFSIFSLVMDGVLLCFSIYFIVKSTKLKKREIIAIEKLKKNK